MGPGAANIKGCLLPYFDLNLSEIEPITGSVMASKNIAIKTAIPAKSAGRPNIWL